MLQQFDIPADLDTPVSAYRKLRDFAPRFLLESVEQGERLGRYSFIGFGDSFDVRISGGHFDLDGKSQPLPDSAEGVLQILRGALQRAPKPGPQPPGVPFGGGLVGVTGYDMARRFESLAVGSATSAAIAAAYFGPSTILVFDHLTRRAALMHDGPESERQSMRQEVIRALRGPSPERRSPGRHSAPVASFDLPSFVETVGRVKGEITAGEVYQLVLSIQFSGECDVEPFEVYRALRLLNPSPYMFFNDFGDLAVIGSSPEALVKLDGRQASLRPIAGTRPRGPDEEADLALEKELLLDPKEAAEHVMLVDLARNDLGRVAVPGSVDVNPYRTIERYSHVMHLVSGVQGVLAPEADAFDLFAASFPAGTVVGAPKIRAMELIDELEPVPRGIYAGTSGYFGHGGAMDQAIAIRTLVLEPGRYTYQAGAGIVSDSDPASEHAEVLAKSAALEAALTLAEEGL
ncbi:MAG: anthranilate synthase component I family protein [Gemmatimonadota bacterium]